MNKKTVRNLIIAGTVGLTATTVGLTTALTACSTTEKATETLSNRSITNLKNAITNEISKQKLTKSEFEEKLLEIVKENFILNNTWMGNLVNSVNLVNNNVLEIELNTNTKYIFSEDFSDDSVILKENTLIITFDALNFYQTISFNTNELSGIRENILNTINAIGRGNFINYFQDIQTNNNIDLLSITNMPTYSQETNTINITLKDNIGLYKFVLYSSEDIQITDSQITINNITTNILASSPESWFTWGTGANANQITGLSSIGLQQENIVLPARATAITNNAFMNNTTLVSVDMTLTSITEIPDGNANGSGGTFYSCKNLENIFLPKNLTYIGESAFTSSSSPSNKISSIIIPKNVASIRNFSFRFMTSLKSITIPEKVTYIGEGGFYSCSALTSVEILSPSVTFGNILVFTNSPSTCVATVKNETVQTALKNAGFTGTIQIKSN